MGKLYCWYMIIYGCIRFGLNLLREHPKQSERFLPIGNIWSIVAVIIGVLWIFIINYINLDKKYKSTQNCFNGEKSVNDQETNFDKTSP